MEKKHAIGIVVKDRWKLTEMTLQSLYYSDQSKNSYDLIIINNGSDEETTLNLRQYYKGNLLPIKYLVETRELSIPRAWNLFFVLAKDYDFRTKMDNDLILHNTINPVTNPFQVKTSLNVNTPEHADPLAGAPRGASVVLGARRSVVKKEKYNSAFLDHMVNFGAEYKVDLVSLVPCTEIAPFRAMHENLIHKTRKGIPYIIGGCMLVTKNAFEKIGYFDERMPRSIDIEYSQRAVRNGINIGYHPVYGVIHMGAKTPTESPQKFQEKHTKVSLFWQKTKIIEQYADTILNDLKYKGKLTKAANNSQIIHFV